MKNKKLMIIGILIALLGVILIGSSVIVSRIVNNINATSESEAAKKNDEEKVVLGTNGMSHSIIKNEVTGKQACQVTVVGVLDINLKNIKIIVLDKQNKIIASEIKIIEDHNVELRVYDIPLDTTSLTDDDVSIELQFNVSE